MIDLALGILFFNVILILFKLFERYNVNNLQAIVVNYLVAGSFGLYFSGLALSFKTIISLEWIHLAIIIGLFFIVVFTLLALGAQKVGISIATIANKMSVVLPVIASFFLYGDSVSFLKILGIILALIGVVLSSTNKGKLSFDRKYLWLILIIFFGQGIADILFNYAQQIYVNENQKELFIAVLFLSAFLSGSLIMFVNIIRKKMVFQLKSIAWGIALGIPNYLTVFFFFKALNNGFMESSQVYPILNMGVIVLSALSGLFFFREKLTFYNWVGILLSILAIAAIGIG